MQTGRQISAGPRTHVLESRELGSPPVRFTSREPHWVDEMALPVDALAYHSAVHAASGPCKAGRICISR